MDKDQERRLNRLAWESQELYSLYKSIESDYLSWNLNIKKEHVELARKKYLEKEKEYQLCRKEYGLIYLIPKED
jgi:hypothetical protein